MKKHHKYYINHTIRFKNHLVFANYGLVSRDWSLLTKTQLDGAILSLKRSLRRKGKLYVRVYPHIPVTRKPLEVRMGKGKGKIHSWTTRVSPGTVLFELSVVSPLIAINAFNLVAKKLSFKTKIIHQKISL